MINSISNFKTTPIAGMIFLIHENSLLKKDEFRDVICNCKTKYHYLLFDSSISYSRI